MCSSDLSTVAPGMGAWTGAGAPPSKAGSNSKANKRGIGMEFPLKSMYFGMLGPRDRAVNARRFARH